MQYSSAILVVACAISNVVAHGVITEVQGANGVVMPGLSIIDGTPRDCSTKRCGAQADTSIIRQKDIASGKASALGRSLDGGAIDPATQVANFMNGAAGNTTAVKMARKDHIAKRAIVLMGLAKRAGVKTPKGTVETGVKAATGLGASDGLPTCAADGTITMTFHQVNQDGAGPLTAAVDATSGGTDPAAFKTAAVTTDVPGRRSLSLATSTDFPVKVQMPAGMICSGSVAGVQNVCVVRLQNDALAGPFGGSAAFTQSPAAKKRAIEYNLRKRRFARALAAKQMA